MNMSSIENGINEHPQDPYILEYRSNLDNKCRAVQNKIAGGLSKDEFSFFTLVHQALRAAVTVINSVVSEPHFTCQGSTVNNSSEIDANTIRQLTELGFLATGKSMLEEAAVICAGLKAIRPQETAPYVIEAINRLCIQEVDATERFVHQGLSESGKEA